jgi:hypothetical protein
MNTLAERPVPVDTLTRRAAVTLLGMDYSPEHVRTRCAGTDREAADKELAAEMEYLAAQGMTPGAARRAVRKLDRLYPAVPASPEEQARNMRDLAGALLDEGWTAAQVRSWAGEGKGGADIWREAAGIMDEIGYWRGVRGVAGAMLREGYTPEYIRATFPSASFQEFADAMEELIAEGLEVTL